ncbi:hypothetical protein H4S01_005024 [Coemansia sp. RSA 2610]|nr:hypothetical protein H4S01_005024 [Coemansia sp. RSA 2610]
MGFPDAAFEQQRVEAAALLNMRLDARTRGDLAVIVLLAAVYFIDLVAVAFMLWNRKYPPLKSKGPVLMAALFVCSVFWFIGDIQVNGHAQLAGSALTDCRGIGFWVRVLLGICGVCAVVALRSYALHQVFALNLPTRGLRFYLPFLVYVACILVYGIVASALSPHVSAEYVRALDICRLDEPFKITIFVFVWVSCLFVALVNWRLRRIKTSFNESREMLVACLIVFAVLTFNTCMQFAQPKYPLVRRLRIPSTLLDHLCCNALLWAIIGRPLAMCAFRRDAYLRAWVATLRSDGLQRAYQVDSSAATATEDVAAHKPESASFFYADTQPSLGAYEETRQGSGFYAEPEKDQEQMWRTEDGGLPEIPAAAFSSSGRLSAADTHSYASSSAASWPQPPDLFGYINDRRLL